MSKSNFELSLIAAVGTNGVIGNGNALPWRIPSDLARFRDITKEKKVMIMGNRTFNSILEKNGKLLPDRVHIVLTRNHKFTGGNGQLFSSGSPELALEQASKLGNAACVIGGAEIYTLFLPHVRRMYYTRVYAEPHGDVHFPKFDPQEWRTESEIERRRWNAKDGYDTSFTELVRANS